MKSHFFDADNVVDLITADHKVFNEEGDFLEQSFFAVLSFLLFKIVRKHMTYFLPPKKTINSSPESFSGRCQDCPHAGTALF